MSLIHFLVDTPNYNKNAWYILILNTPRTLAEWYTCIEEMKKPFDFKISSEVDIKIEIPPFVPGAYADPWNHRKEVAEYMEEILYTNLRMRWIAHKWIARIRQRIAARRIIGADMDVATCEHIPPNYKVSVIDTKSNTTYVFHATTLYKSCLESLSFQLYGFAGPVRPKNPYTNLYWNIGQLIVIMSQLQIIYMRERHAFIHTYLVAFRNNEYDIPRFYANNSHQLQLSAIRNYFKDSDNLNTFHELIQDLLEDISMPKHGRVFRHISSPSISTSLLSEWKDLAATYWIFRHFHDSHITYPDILYAAENLYNKTRLQI